MESTRHSRSGSITAAAAAPTAVTALTLLPLLSLLRLPPAPGRGGQRQEPEEPEQEAERARHALALPPRPPPPLPQRPRYGGGAAVRRSARPPKGRLLQQRWQPPAPFSRHAWSPAVASRSPHAARGRLDAPGVLSVPPPGPPFRAPAPRCPPFGGDAPAASCEGEGSTRVPPALQLLRHPKSAVKLPTPQADPILNAPSWCASPSCRRADSPQRLQSVFEVKAIVCY